MCCRIEAKKRTRSLVLGVILLQVENILKRRSIFIPRILINLYMVPKFIARLFFLYIALPSRMTNICPSSWLAYSYKFLQ